MIGIILMLIGGFIIGYSLENLDDAPTFIVGLGIVLIGLGLVLKMITAPFYYVSCYTSNSDGASVVVYEGTIQLTQFDYNGLWDYCTFESEE